MLRKDVSRVLTQCILSCLAFGLPGRAIATISCNFADTVLPLCGWVPKSQGSVWKTGLDGLQAPPAGFEKYAYIRSGQESWASLTSEAFSFKSTEPTKLSFAVIQQRFELTSIDFVQLQLVSAEGQTVLAELWSVDNSIPGWMYDSRTLTPQSGVFRLRFLFKVGLTENLAALGALVLEREDAAIEILKTQPELPIADSSGELDVPGGSAALVNLNDESSSQTEVDPAMIRHYSKQFMRQIGPL